MLSTTSEAGQTVLIIIWNCMRLAILCFGSFAGLTAGPNVTAFAVSHKICCLHKLLSSSSPHLCYNSRVVLDFHRIVKGQGRARHKSCARPRKAAGMHDMAGACRPC